MWKRVVVAASLVPQLALAQGQYSQDPQGQGQYPQQYPQGQYPQQYPQGQYPQQYPQGQYPQQYPYGYPQQYPYGYPQQQAPYGYPPPQQPQRPQQAGYPVAPPPKPPRMLLGSRSEAAVSATWACADALDRRRLDLARAKCGEAVAKDDTIAYAHLLLAQAQAPDVARQELKRAVELERNASNGERLFIEAWRAQAEARLTDATRLYDQLVATLPGEPRAAVARGHFRLQAGDLDGAIADFKRALEIDPRYGAAGGMLALTLARRGQLDEARDAAKKAIELQPGDATAHLQAARVALLRGEPAEALAAAQKAVTIDDQLAAAHATRGDALLFLGRGKDARKAFAVELGTDDPAVHHDGAMREARSWLYEGRLGESEKSLAAEADLAQKTRRPGDEADARLELGRLQLDRGAVTDAGQTARQVLELLANKDLQAAMSDEERRRYTGEALQLRAMVLAAVGERQFAEQRADELQLQLRVSGDPHAAEQVTALKGWIAARNHDDKAALQGLTVATRPTFRMALALALFRAGEQGRARAIMEELAKRAENDLEGALTRPRAAAWLKTR